MTLYAGEEVKITSTAVDFDGGDNLGADELASVEIELFGSAPDFTPLEDGAMIWDSSLGFWYYMWDTTGLDPGTYRARVTAVGSDGTRSWEFKRIRLARNPIP